MCEGAVGELIRQRSPELKPEVLAGAFALHIGQGQVSLTRKPSFQARQALTRCGRKQYVRHQDQCTLDQGKGWKGLHHKELGILFVDPLFDHFFQAFVFVFLHSPPVQIELHLLRWRYVGVVLSFWTLDGWTTPSHSFQLSLGGIAIICHLRSAHRRFPYPPAPLQGIFDHLKLVSSRLPFALQGLAKHRSLAIATFHPLEFVLLLVVQAQRAKPVTEKVRQSFFGTG
mmetsp:Transcript_85145/g.134925  ORF Transcript_85145/g.134925 Transcript_85145/m.134925 type:complete len:228 (+) Transcript_85145:763-1446(+)